MPVFVLDGDDLRKGMNADLGFSTEDRNENVRRVTELAKVLVYQQAIVLVALISPIQSQRNWARKQFEPDRFLETFVDAPLAVCAKRDVKQLYARARDGQLPNMTGINAPYEPPNNPELHLRTDLGSVKDHTSELLAYLRTRRIIE